ncbi:Lrp/AsnC family transcriptional regulator [Nocardiopsis halophila]|uniref:Lrp/AsnC family transcriptional regulator n=1 Tax=Nocardiopsis halophila TaxID=141692 RepID=UPI000345B545|nr:Lrp/AsnC family transcriptional regulator [Nocardiopsis halophila]
MQDSQSTAQDGGRVDEFDLQLLNALQLAPRAPWVRLGEVLGADATTLARRWERLRRSGLARVTAFPGAASLPRQTMAYLELTCRNGTVAEVSRALADDPGTLSIQFTAGRHQLLLTVSHPRDLAGYLLDWIGSFPDVAAYATHVITGIPFQADRWHLHALAPDQRRVLRAMGGPAPGDGAPPPVSRADQAIIGALAADGRASHRELGRAAGVSAGTAARRLERLLRGGAVGVRCDVARERLGWPAAAVLWGSVEPEVLERAAADLEGAVPELRFCSTVAGSENALLVVWLRAVADLPRVEQRLAARLPGLRVTDRRMVLRTMKLMGQVMDEEGRYVRTVPLRLREEAD